MSKKTILAITLMTLLMQGSALGSAVMEKIEVYRGDIKIVINNTPVQSEYEPFIYKNRVYVPLRFVSESLEKDIEWVPASHSVVIRDRDFGMELEDCRPDRGEVFVYGEILDIDYNNYTIRIEQHYDDNSKPVGPVLSVRTDAVILLRTGAQENIHFYQLKKGDTGGFILDSKGTVRGIIVSR